MKSGAIPTKAIEKFLLGDPIWIPRPGPQFKAYFHEADEIYYGGRAGGGKTDLILGIAPQDHHRSLILRRIYPQLEAIKFRAEQIYGSTGSYSSLFNCWTFKDKGYKQLVQFGAIQYDKDKYNYQGRPFDFLAFDEITQFLFSQFVYLKGWNRTTDPNQRCRIICTGNPPSDSDGAWVIDYWAPWLDRFHPNPAEPGELRWFIMKGIESIEVDGPDPVNVDWAPDPVKPHSRTFIPAKMLQELKDTGYDQKLQSLPEPLRSQLLYGDFEMFQEDDAFQIIPTEWILIAMERWDHMQVPKVQDPETGQAIQAPMDYAGVDVARGGKDFTIIAPRYAYYFDELKKFPGKATPDGQSVAGQVVQTVEKDTIINIDIIGVGSSPYDYLSDYGYNVRGINSAEKSDATDKTGQLRFRNLRAEMWWKFREILDPDDGEEIALPNSKSLLRDLTTPRWKLTASGIQVESKEDIIKRLGHSPDEGDAVVMAGHSQARVGMIG